ncbi:hypothetical protein OCU04_008020 [Sclerotinia nivalis]|uniref:Uncharacterized protein n=1 Tax=Sclerotinia nivalis TaxID=352851 RepID=A0A9X0DGL1_9HELO|nr:hypothetical protein OCU04_008020 [Sclerotinia nivalis]
MSSYSRRKWAPNFKRAQILTIEAIGASTSTSSVRTSVIAHTHIILALLASPKDPLSIPHHLHLASLQINTLLSHICKPPHSPNNFNPAPLTLLTQQYSTFISTLQKEHRTFITYTPWKPHDETYPTIGCGADAFRCEEFEMQIKNSVTGDYDMEGFRSPVLPLVEKSEEEIGREKFERGLWWWRFLGRELMKGGQGEDVRVLGGVF